MLLDVKPHPTPDVPADPDLVDTDAKPKRMSVMFYMADEHNYPIEVQTDAVTGHSREGSSRALQGGSDADAWQLHVGSSSKLPSMGLCRDTLC